MLPSPAHTQSQCSHPVSYSSSLPCTQSPHSCPVICRSSHAHSRRPDAPVPFPLPPPPDSLQRTGVIPHPLQQLHPTRRCTEPALAPLLPTVGDSRRGTRTEGVLPPFFLQPFSPTHTRTPVAVSRDPRTPTRSPRSHPVPYGSSPPRPPPHSHPFLHSHCFMQTHVHTHVRSHPALRLLPHGNSAPPPTPGVSAHSLLHGVINPRTHSAHTPTPSPIATPPHILPLCLAPSPSPTGIISKPSCLGSWDDTKGSDVSQAPLSPGGRAMKVALLLLIFFYGTCNLLTSFSTWRRLFPTPTHMRALLWAAAGCLGGAGLMQIPLNLQ